MLDSSYSVLHINHTNCLLLITCDESVCHNVSFKCIIDYENYTTENCNSSVVFNNVINKYKYKNIAN